MIRRLAMALVLSAGFGAAQAQEPDCALYMVGTSILNIASKAGGNRFIDVMEIGEVACVGRRENSGGRSWGYIAHKVSKPDKKTPVDGWASMALLRPMSNAEISEAGLTVAGRGGAAPATASRPPPAVRAPTPSTASRTVTEPAKRPTPAGTATRPAASEDDPDVPRFNQPVPFGPYPVNGRSLEELATSQPLFPPIEGLPDELWKDKSCTTCHKWNQVRLCDQGKTYVKTARHVLRHQHPFGGAYKVALMRWAKNGCK